MCSIIYYGNIKKDIITLSYFLLYYYIGTHSYCVPTPHLLVPALTTGAPHVASCDSPFTILTHSGGQILKMSRFVCSVVYKKSKLRNPLGGLMTVL